MTRATIKLIGHRTVDLSYDDMLTGDRRTREFHISGGDGWRYVREGDRQVCKGLDRLGDTLVALDDGGSSLLSVIREEYRAMRAYEAKA